MLKTTSLVVAVPLTTELYSRRRDISAADLPADPAAAGRRDLVPRDHAAS